MYFLLLSLFLIWPFGSLPLMLYLMYHQKRYAWYFLGALIALFAMYYPPTGDQLFYWRNFQETNSIIDTLIATINTENIRGLSIIHPIYSLIKNLNGNFEYVRFVLIFTSYCLCLNFFWNNIDNFNKIISNKKYYLLLSIFFMAIPVCPIMTGFRWGSAVVLFFLAASNFVIGNRVLGVIFTILAGIFHFAILPYIALFVLCYLTRNIIWEHPIVILITAIVITFTIDNFITYLLGIPSLNFVSTYIDPDGTWRTGELPYETSTLSKIGYFVNNCIFYLFLLFIPSIICKYKRSQNKFVNSYPSHIFNFTFLLIVLFIVFRNFYTISERMTHLIFLFSSGAFVSAYLKNTNYFSRRTLIVYFLFMTFFFCFSWISLRKPFILAKSYRFFYATAYTAFNNTYSTDWVFLNVSQDGDPIIKE